MTHLRSIQWPLMNAICVYQRCSSIAICASFNYSEQCSVNILYMLCAIAIFDQHAESNAILHTNNSIVHDAQYALHTVHRTHKTEQISNKKL